MRRSHYIRDESTMEKSLHGYKSLEEPPEIYKLHDYVEDVQDHSTDHQPVLKYPLKDAPTTENHEVEVKNEIPSDPLPITHEEEEPKHLVTDPAEKYDPPENEVQIDHGSPNPNHIVPERPPIHEQPVSSDYLTEVPKHHRKTSTFLIIPNHHTNIDTVTPPSARQPHVEDVTGPKEIQGTESPDDSGSITTPADDDAIQEETQSRYKWVYDELGFTLVAIVIGLIIFRLVKRRRRNRQKNAFAAALSNKIDSIEPDLESHTIKSGENIVGSFRGGAPYREFDIVDKTLHPYPERTYHPASTLTRAEDENTNSSELEYTSNSEAEYIEPNLKALDEIDLSPGRQINSGIFTSLSGFETPPIPEIHSGEGKNTFRTNKGDEQKTGNDKLQEPVKAIRQLNRGPISLILLEHQNQSRDLDSYSKIFVGTLNGSVKVIP